MAREKGPNYSARPRGNPPRGLFLASNSGTTMLDPEMMRRAAPAFSLVGSMTSSVIAGALIGTWLDGRFGTTPWLTLGLVLGGFVVGLRHLILFLNRPQPPDAPPDPPAP